MKRLFPSKPSGFTLVELLIVLVIITTLSVAAYLGIQNSQNRNMNAKVLSDLVAIENALDQFQKNNNGLYPVPTVGEANLLCFGKNTAYVHDCDADAFFVQSYVTQNLVTERYLPNLPLDPRTGAPYAYGVSIDGKSFQVAGNYWDKKEGIWLAKVEGELEDGFPLNSLIRSYSGPDFVTHEGTVLPYHPQRFEMNAQLYEPSTGVTVTNSSGKSVDLNETLRENYTIKVPKGGEATLYFADGSVAVLGSPGSVSELTILSPSDQAVEDAGPVTRVFLKLSEGRVFNKVLRMSGESEFVVQSTTAIAGVRGTEFILEVGTGQDGSDRLYVYAGEVGARSKTVEELSEAYVEIGKDDLGDPAFIVASDNQWISVDLTEVANQPVNLQPNEQSLLTKAFLNRVALSNSIRPVLLGVDAPNSFTLQALDVLNEGQVAQLDATKVYVCAEGMAELCELGSSVCNLAACEEFDLPQAQDDTYVVPAIANDFANLEIQNPNRFAFGVGNELSAFSYPAVFLNPATQLNEEDVQEYEEEVVLIEEPQPNVEDDPQVKCEQGGGYWEGGACWVLGAKDQICTDACSDFGVENDMGGLSCDELNDWDDTQDCDICKSLVGDENSICSASGKAYAPYYWLDQQKCFQSQGVQAACDEVPDIPDVFNRACKCVL